MSHVPKKGHCVSVKFSRAMIEVSNTIQLVGVTILLVLVFTRIYTTLRFLVYRHAIPRPPLPYTIPWVGHLFGLSTGLNKYISKVRKRYPTDPLVTIQMAGRRAHIIFDAKLTSQVHRQPRALTFDPSGISTAFGVPEHDNRMMDNSTGQGRSLLQDMDRSLVGALEGDNLDRMIKGFVSQLNANLDAQFGSEGEQRLDLCAWAKKQYTLASIPYLFGTRILDDWPTISEDFWHYDRYLISLMLPVPGFARREAEQARRKMLDGMRRWEARALQHRPLADIQKSNPGWDEYWGERLTRERHNVLLNHGITKDGRTGHQLGLMWAQNANTIPIGLWMLIHTVLDPVLHAQVHAAASACRTSSSDFDLHALVTNPILKSLFLEALRFGVAVAPVRAVTAPSLLGGLHPVAKGDLVFLPARPAQTDPRVWTDDREAQSETAGESDPLKFWAGRFLVAGGDKKGDVTTTEASQTSTADKSRQSHRVEALSLPPASAHSATLKNQMSHVRPFGGGPWLCPGRNLSMYEIIVGLVVLVCRFEIRVDQDALKARGPPGPDLSRVGGMDPDRPLLVDVRPRLK